MDIIEEDIKILEKFLKYADCENKCVKTGNCFDCYIEYEEVKAIRKLLKAYQEDEKVIDLMSSYILKNTCVLDWDGYEPKVKEYFRKKVKDK